MRISARFFLFLLLFLVGFSFLKKQSFAQTPPPIQAQEVQQFLQPNTNSDVPQNQHTYIQSAMIEVLSSMVCQLSGYDPISSDHKCLGVDSKTGKIGFVENGGGAISAMGSLISYTYIKPIGTTDYVHYLSNNFGLSKRAYAVAENTGRGGGGGKAESVIDDCNSPKAQGGIGFCSIKPLTSIWISMRNIVYLLFTVVFLIIGVAIMLRIHIDPRTVMTLQNQIPKIIIGLLLVTFSLALSGLLIDVMYVSIYLIGSVLGGIKDSGGTPILDMTRYYQTATSTNPFQALGIMAPDGFVGLSNTVGTAVTGATGIHFVIPILNWDLAAVVISLIALLAILYALIRVWVALIIAYISILLDIVFSPFWFVAGLLPGSSMGVGAWFKDMLANLAVFPTVIAMFALGVIFSKIGDPNGTAVGSKIFNPPMIGGIDNSTATIGGLITFGFIFMTPHALKIVKDALKAPKLNFGPVFQPMQVATGAVASLPKRFVSAGERYRYSKDATGLDKVFRFFGSPYYFRPPKDH